MSCECIVRGALCVLCTKYYALITNYTRFLFLLKEVFLYKGGLLPKNKKSKI